MSGGPSDADARALFARIHHDADEMLRRDVAPEAFAVWVLATVRRQPEPELRHTAVDAVMAAMDDDEAREARS